MDFPDKIYAYFSFPNISGHLRSRMWCIDPIGPGENIEYIRKDALLELAKEELSKASVSSDSIGRRNAFIDVVDKLNSM